MDPVSLVVGALAVGVSESVTEAVRDSYAGLRDALVRRMRRTSGERHSDAEDAVQTLEAQAVDQVALFAAVRSAGVATDADVLSSAHLVLEAAHHAGATVGKYVIDLREAKGVQVGDNPTMTINF